MTAGLRYEADVVGHRAPFKWTLYRTGGTTSQRYQVKQGTADTYDEALDGARTAAIECEDERRHAATRSKPVLLFVVSAEGQLIPGEVSELESWPVLGEHQEAEPVPPPTPPTVSWPSHVAPDDFVGPVE